MVVYVGMNDSSARANEIQNMLLSERTIQKKFDVKGTATIFCVREGPDYLLNCVERNR